MRTKRFSFKKTVKTTKVFPAIEVCLTEQEAADLAEIVGNVAGLPSDHMIHPLYAALRTFSYSTKPTFTSRTMKTEENAVEF